ncbi:MAG: cyclic nucleotide-binding protein, partial [Lentilactobacillus hilgardii]
MAEEQTAICFIDHQKHMVIDGQYLRDLEPATRNLIKSEYPSAKVTDFICDHDLLKYQLMRVDGMVKSDVKQTRKINRRLTRAMQSDDYEIVDVNENLERTLTMGQRISDAVARFGGSWG